MLDRKEDDWCIVKFKNEYDHLTVKEKTGLPQYDLLVVRRYQWEPQGNNYQYKWEYVAEGIESNELACEWVRKYEKLLKEQ